MGQENNNAEEECGRFRLPSSWLVIILSSQADRGFVFGARKNAIVPSNPHKKKGKQALLFDEWDKLAKEERLYVQEIEVEENNQGGIRLSLMYGGDEVARLRTEIVTKLFYERE